MSDIIVIAFRHPDAAQQVAAQFQNLEDKHALRLIGMPEGDHDNVAHSSSPLIVSACSRVNTIHLCRMVWRLICS